MVALGVALLLIGAALLVAEAHVPAGVLGVLGGASLAAGSAVVIAAAGGGIVVIVPIALGAAAIAALWLTVATRKALVAQSGRARSGTEALSGHLGTVRSWAGDGGQVLVDGALWRARRCWDEEEGAIAAGDQIVVERVSGLTLGVRKAEDWEVPW
jgi:membrane-bound ClpP family serine protease